MKTILLSILIVLSISCSSSDEKATSTPAIVGQWKATKYEPGFSPTNNYVGEEIKWTFSTDNTVNVVIVSGTTINPTMPLNASGTYPYLVNSINSITLNNVIYYFSIQGNELIVRTAIDVSADGSKLTFAKIQ